MFLIRPLEPPHLLSQLDAGSEKLTAVQTSRPLVWWFTTRCCYVSIFSIISLACLKKPQTQKPLDGCELQSALLLSVLNVQIQAPRHTCSFFCEWKHFNQEFSSSAARRFVRCDSARKLQALCPSLKRSMRKRGKHKIVPAERQIFLGVGDGYLCLFYCSFSHNMDT